MNIGMERPIDGCSIFVCLIWLMVRIELHNIVRKI